MTEGRHPVTMTPMRAAIARQMVQSKQQAPHFYVVEIEMDALAEALEQRNQGRSRAGGSRSRPISSGRWPSSRSIRPSTPPGRVTSSSAGTPSTSAWRSPSTTASSPGPLDCGARSVDDLARGLADLTARTRAGRLKAAEIDGCDLHPEQPRHVRGQPVHGDRDATQVAILATGRAYERRSLGPARSSSGGS
jgi:pyruvate/2-oxoglutarate dehydrogenase complex dihydrolipoamide acyltransferase (E2) component